MTILKITCLLLLLNAVIIFTSIRSKSFKTKEDHQREGEEILNQIFNQQNETV